MKGRDLEASASKTQEFECRKIMNSKERYEFEGIESWVPYDIISLVQ